MQSLFSVEADEVAQSASVDDQAKVNDWRLEEQNSPSIEEFQTFLVHTRSRWKSPILSYLKDGRLPPNPEEAKKIQKRAARFIGLNVLVQSSSPLSPLLFYR